MKWIELRLPLKTGIQFALASIQNDKNSQSNLIPQMFIILLNKIELEYGLTNDLTCFHLLRNWVIFKFFFFFVINLNKLYQDYTNQLGNSASIWTTKCVCFLALRARVSAFVFIVRKIWMIFEWLKLSWKISVSSK